MIIFILNLLKTSMDPSIGKKIFIFIVIIGVVILLLHSFGCFNCFNCNCNCNRRRRSRINVQPPPIIVIGESVLDICDNNDDICDNNDDITIIEVQAVQVIHE